MTEEQQRYLELKIGKHVTEQNMWKLVEKQKVAEFFSEKEQHFEIENLSDMLIETRADQILIGYISPYLDQGDGETFLFCFGEREAETISEIVRQLEAKSRKDAKKILYKHPRPWKTLGSEAEVDCLVDKPKSVKVEIEVQRLQRSESSPKKLGFRMAEDTRDGYVELLCDKSELKVIEIDRVDIGIQTTSQLASADQQTDPTFPANAWTQYHYDVEEESSSDKDEEAVDENEESENEDSKDPIQISNAVSGLLKILEFNSIDVYR